MIQIGKMRRKVLTSKRVAECKVQEEEAMDLVHIGKLKGMEMVGPITITLTGKIGSMQSTETNRMLEDTREAT